MIKNKLFFYMHTIALAVLLGLSCSAQAFEVSDIRLEGLQRIAAGTVFTYMPLRVGETLTEKRASEVLKTLYETGFFLDIKLGRSGNELVLKFQERPSIANIEIDGNELITDEQLEMVLKDLNLVKGRIFNPSQLEKITLELRQQYYSQGKYGVTVESEIKPLDNNLVEIDVTIDEGDAARIHRINVVGNKAYEEDDLLDRLELGEAPFFSLFDSRDQYSKQKMLGDIESLRSYYFDRGYLEFNIDSTQVSITPDKQGVYVTVNLTEGEQFRLASVRLVGELIVDEAELMDLVKIQLGDIYSRKLLTESTSAISERLGYEGYAFANINAVPDVNHEDRTIALTIYVDPGKRVYVRRINIAGNTKTFDEVLRREVRQMEGGWLSTQKVNRSRTRIQRLPYMTQVSVETPAVPGSADQVDVNFTVEEGSSGSLQAGAGYSTNGAIFNVAVSEQNFLGSGESVRLSFDNSSAVTTYNLSLTDPYFTLDGISRGFSIYSTTTDGGGASVADYNTDVLGGSLSFGFPLSEYEHARVSLEVEKIDLEANEDRVGPIINNWVVENGNQFNSTKINSSWSYDSRDRTLFATRGVLQRLSLESALPGTGLEYFKIRHKQTWLFPFISTSSLSFSTDVGYGQGFGDTEGMPFFKNFYLGGVNSLRGFASNSLGPYDYVTWTEVADDGMGGTVTTTHKRKRVIGGNKLLSGSLEWLFPSPFEEHENSMRLSYFVDGGYVFGYNIPLDSQTFQDELRVSHGVAMKWVTPVGVLSFSLGYPVRTQPEDEHKRFQFTIGAPF